MTKATRKTRKSPDKLAKIGMAAGVELTERELGKAAGGALKFDYKIIQVATLPDVKTSD